MEDQYEPSAVEQKWQRRWEEAKVYEVDLENAKDPYYTHVMFPYPSGDKLHIGHWYNYAPADSFARYMKMKGKDVFSPIGFDSFGLPAENYAIKTGVPPGESISKNVETMISQLKRIGTMYDWDKSVSTSTPEYYKWTQWLFVQMFKNDLAYKKYSNVNWCNSCKTVLANEQVHDGFCERCGTEVVQKPLDQWFLRITQYAQQLLDDLDDLNWPQKTKLMQRNWIGRSEGCNVSWQVEGHDTALETYTTTVDTIYGVTFAVISPEHPTLNSLVSDAQQGTVKAYCKAAEKKTDIDRMADDKEKTGVNTGAMLIHPFTGKQVPLWVADYVLMNYGTGVVMGVPAHDQRDMDFAHQYKFPIVQSIKNSEGESFVYDEVDKYNIEGVIIDSGEYTDLSIQEGRIQITQKLEEQKKGNATIQYRLRDWSIGRQRYWGAPIPIVYDPEGNAHAVPDEHLPWKLPDDVDFKPDGTAPLARSEELKQRVIDIFGEGWTPEVDTMDAFVCSSFYSLMYIDAFNNKDLEKKWMPVDMYIGGAEHACMHLIYARFVQKALKDFGYVTHNEPYLGLIHQGMVTNQGAKMSKSKGNAVSPDAFVETHGSDVFRMYLMFMGPFAQGGDWSDTGIKGVDRFVKKILRVFRTKVNTKFVQDDASVVAKLHATIKKVTEDIDRFQFNTALSALMELMNVVDKQAELTVEVAQTFAKLIAPMAPHLAEELWEMTGGEGFIIDQEWPTYDEALLVTDTIIIVAQINGKVRAEFEVAADISAEDAIALVKANENVKSHLEGKQIKKEIYVPGKLVSLVV